MTRPGSEHDTPSPDRDTTADGSIDDATPPPQVGHGSTQGANGAGRGFSRQALLAAVVGGLLLVALVVVVTGREPVQLPPDSPEATVQAFLQSVVDGTPDTSLLVSDACPDGIDTGFVQDHLRATVIDAAIDGDVAEVTLSITETYGSGVFDDGYQHDEAYDLVRTDDGWRISGFEWPHDACWNGRARRPVDAPTGAGPLPGSTATASGEVHGQVRS